jgi:large subunit ribosomal protein L18
MNKKMRVRFQLKQKNKENRLRLSVHRTESHIYGQIIDGGKTILSVSSYKMSFSGNAKSYNVEGAKLVGETLAKKAQEMGISKVYFDRGEFLYHGRIKAFAEAARKGLDF